MSLDKAIFSGKEHRKPWYDARAFDPMCRNHGNDTYYTQKVLQSELRRKRLITELKYKEGMKELYINAN